jgi:ketosteroid isomerase-like protein
MSTQDVADRFVEALWALEGDQRELDPIVAVFADDAAIGNVVAARTFEGPDGARDFWREYRSVFDDMRSEFRTRTVQDDRAVLEWRTRGTLVHGDAVDYEGVSVLEVDGDRVRRFTAYFNPRHLGQPTRLEGAAG